MFPIRDHNPSTRTPYVTFGLIALNVLIFLLTLPAYGDDMALASLYGNWAMIPERVSGGQQTYTLITSMFMHGGLLHLGGNMLFLLIFGDNLEDQMGHVMFVLFYLACGLGAGAAHIMADTASRVPTVGASGAIAGVMGGYLLLFPRAKVDVAVILIIFFKIFTLPAWIMLGLWFGLQVVSGIGDPSSGGGVAYWAHAGGFVVGIVLALPVWLRRGGTAFWQRTHGHPPHPEGQYKQVRTSIPQVRRR